MKIITFEELPEYCKNNFKRKFEEEISKDFEKMGFLPSSQNQIDYLVSKEIKRHIFCKQDSTYFYFSPQFFI